MSRPRTFDTDVAQLGAEVTMFCRSHGVNAKGGPDSSCVLASFFEGLLAIRAAWRPIDRRTRLFELLGEDHAGVIELCLCTVALTHKLQAQSESSTVTTRLEKSAKVPFALPRNAGIGTVSTCDTLDVVSASSDAEEPESPSERETKTLFRTPTAFQPPPGLELPRSIGLQQVRKGIHNRTFPCGYDQYDHSFSSCIQSSANSGLAHVSEFG